MPEHAGAAKELSPDLEALANRALVQRLGPVGILCSDNGDVLYVSGRTGRYLEPAVGRANLNVLAMARDGLRRSLSRAFAAALREERPISVRGLEVGAKGGSTRVDLTVQKLGEPSELRGTVLIIIADDRGPAAAPNEKTPPRRRGARESVRLAELRRDLEKVQLDLRNGASSARSPTWSRASCGAAAPMARATT